MSIALPIVDLTSAGVGFAFTVTFNNVGIGAGGISANPNLFNNKPHVKIHNDSGCGLFLLFRTEQDSDHIPPGAWRTYQVLPGEAAMDLTVEYVMQNPPASKFTATYYFPGEYIDQVGTLGNSPTGGTTTTTSIQTLSNESTAGIILVIDIGQSGNQQLIQINNDGSCLWSVVQASVVHQVLKIQSTGNPLLLGKSGDVSEVLGKIQSDNGCDLIGTAFGVISLGQKAHGDTLDTDGSGALYLKAPTGQTINFQIPNGTTVGSVDNNGIKNATYFIGPNALATNATINNGNTNTYTCTGSGVPSGAQGVYLVGQFTPSTNNVQMTVVPHGTSWSVIYPSANAQSTGNIVTFAFWTKVDGNGQIDVKSNNGNMAGFYLAVNAYLY